MDTPYKGSITSNELSLALEKAVTNEWTVLNAVENLLAIVNQRANFGLSKENIDCPRTPCSLRAPIPSPHKLAPAVQGVESDCSGVPYPLQNLMLISPIEPATHHRAPFEAAKDTTTSASTSLLKVRGSCGFEIIDSVRILFEKPLGFIHETRRPACYIKLSTGCLEWTYVCLCTRDPSLFIVDTKRL